MIKKKPKISLSGLQGLEKSFEPKTTETIKSVENNPAIPIEKEESTTGNNDSIASVEKSTSSKKLEDKEHQYESFESFINKKFEWKDSDQMKVDKDVKRVLEKIASFRKDTTQVSLVSNILKSWLEQYRTDIQKLFKEHSKIDF